MHVGRVYPYLLKARILGDPDLYPAFPPMRYTMTVGHWLDNAHVHPILGPVESNDGYYAYGNNWAEWNFQFPCDAPHMVSINCIFTLDPTGTFIVPGFYCFLDGTLQSYSYFSINGNFDEWDTPSFTSVPTIPVLVPQVGSLIRMSIKAKPW